MRVLNTDIAQFFEIDNMEPGKFELNNSISPDERSMHMFFELKE